MCTLIFLAVREFEAIATELRSRNIEYDMQGSHQAQTVRIRKGPGKYELRTVREGATLKEDEEQERIKRQQKEDKQRSIQLAKLMKYKEEKLQRDQERLEYEKLQKEREQKKERKMMEKQNKHNDEIKKKLEEWHSKREEDEK